MFVLKTTLRNSKIYSSLTFKNASFSAAAAKIDGRFMIIDIKTNKNTTKNEQFKYSLLWLRDNCQCPSCFHTQTKSRIIDWSKFDMKNAQAKTFTADKDLEITWKDNHVSRFDLDWLQERSFLTEDQNEYLDQNYIKPQLWSKDQFLLKEFRAADVLESDEGLYQWCLTLSQYGVVKIKNAPLKEDQCAKLANRIGFIRETHFGREYVVRANPKAKNYSYTSNPLQFHTDLPFYEYAPGVTILHCIAQSKSTGAYNILADGFYVAQKLKQEHPQAYKCLTTTPVNWCDYGDENGFRFEKVLRMPAIRLDDEGNVSRITHSVTKRDSFFSISVEKIDDWYAAWKLFVDLLYEHAVYFKTEPGDILTFSNTRLVHGRTGYVDNEKEGDVRHLVGTFVDWDEVYSRLRVLARDRRTDLQKIRRISSAKADDVYINK